MLRVLKDIALSTSIKRCSTQLAEQKWDLLSAVSLERKPLITRELNDLETKMAKMLEKMELEFSHRSDFEINLMKDAKRAKELKEGKLNVGDTDSAPQQTAQDFLDKRHEELKEFKPENRKGNDMEEKDIHSTIRAMDRHLLLLVEEKIGNKAVWILPQGVRLEQESLRDTAERVLREKCGERMEVRFLGNAPCGFYKYKYPKSLSDPHGVIGAKIFFFKAQLLKGNADITKSACSDFSWTTRKEMTKMPQQYSDLVKQFLVDEHY